jgi:hypothetical protein
MFGRKESAFPIRAFISCFSRRFSLLFGFVILRFPVCFTSVENRERLSKFHGVRLYGKFGSQFRRQYPSLAVRLLPFLFMILQKIRERAAADPQHIILPEGEDVRTINAAAMCARDR